MKNFSQVNYIELFWAVMALLFGTVFHNEINLESANIFTNIAVILIVASPIFVNRFINSQSPSQRTTKIVLWSYTTTCAFLILPFFINSNAPAICLLPAACAAMLWLLKNLSSRKSVLTDAS